MTKQTTNIAQFQPLPKSRGRRGMYLWSGTNKPSWGNVVSVDQIKSQLSGIYTQIKDLLGNASENTNTLQQKIKDLRAAREDLVNADFTAEYKAEQLAALDAAINGMLCLVGEPSASGSKQSVTLNSSTCDAASVGANIDAAKAAGENSTINPYFGDVFDENGIPISIGEAINTGHSRVIIKTLILGTQIHTYKHLAEYKFTNSSDFCLLSKIMEFYWTDSRYLNNNLSVLQNSQFTIRMEGKSKSFGCNACNSCPWKSGSGLMNTNMIQKSIMAYVDINGFVSPYYSYKWILSNILYHEFIHLSGLDVGTDTSQDELNIHCEVYYKQFSHPSFIKSGDTFIKESWSSVRQWYIDKLLPNQKSYWKTKFINLNIPGVN
jgi:hypothetical protein